MVWQTLLYWVSIIAILITGLTVLSANRKPAFVYYSLFSVSIAAWLASQFFIDNNIAQELNIGLGLLIIEVTAGLFLLFALSFPDRPTVPKKYLLIAFAPLLVLGPFSFSSSIASINQQGYIEYTWLYVVQTTAIAGLVIAGLYILIRQFLALNEVERGQLRLLFLAFLPFCVAIYLTGVTFADNENAQYLRPLAALIMVLIIIYAMVRRQLFNIRSFAVRATAYSLTTIIVAFLYIGPSTYVFMKILGFSFEPFTFIAMVVFGTVIATNYARVKAWFNKISNKIFLRDAYSATDLMSELNRMLIASVEPRRLVSSAAMVINKGFKPLYCYFILFSTTKNDKNPIYIGANITPESEKWLAGVLNMISDSQYGNSLLTEQLPQNSELRINLSEHNVAASIKLISSGREGCTLGYMLVGARKSGKTYDFVDAQVLEAIASTLTIALQNALYFEQISHFNVTLQQKIDDATEQLQQSNDRLREIDRAKDEFISMASHQLRTPLTSAKGYLSMVLEGDAGPIQNEKQYAMINQAFQSSQRMAYLVSDMLNLSRLKSGKFVIRRTSVDLAAIVAEEVAQLRFMAEGHKVRLIYNAPTNFPRLTVDATKTRQVIMNFIDNAIYYTKRGGTVTVRLEDEGEVIKYTVTDTGIGIPEAEQQELFTKFFRASNAQHIRPDGTGLGLFMAHNVIFAQGGTMIFRSEEGKGSVFGFTLPKKAVQQVKNIETKLDTAVQSDYA